MRVLIYLCLTATAITTAIGQKTDVIDIVKESIRYHDPEGKMMQSRMTFYLTETRPNGADRSSVVTIDPAKSYTRIERTVDGDVSIMERKGSKSKFWLNGSKRISAADREKHGLTKERLSKMANYYRYLWYAPYPLLDEGTHIDPSYTVVDFNGETGIELKVSYDPAVGSDTWYFYFGPVTKALIGYRFYHDESKGDGEYIMLSDMMRKEGIVIQSRRRWMMHQGDKYLGTDQLTDIKIE